MTEAQAKERLREARARAYRFARLRNLWRRIVARRLQRLREILAAVTHRRGNLIEGGTLEARIAFLFKVAPRLFRLYYSEPGEFFAGRWAVTNVPSGGYRSDCSSWAQNVVRCVGAGGTLAGKIIGAYSDFYTGWVTQNCPVVDRHYAETHIGTAVVYGSGTGFHMGLSLGDGQRTIEHGTPSLDYGTFDEFGEGTEVRYFRFLT